MWRGKLTNSLSECVLRKRFNARSVVSELLLVVKMQIEGSASFQNINAFSEFLIFIPILLKIFALQLFCVIMLLI